MKTIKGNEKKIRLSERVLYGLIIMLMCIFYFSCNPDISGTRGETIETEDSIKSNLEREKDPQSIKQDRDELVSGNTRFAFDLYHILTAEKENIFISPHSISIALSMTYAGARNNTEAQMSRTLHFTLSQESLHREFNVLDLELAKRGQNMEKEEFQLHICNATWGQKGYNFLQDYLDVLALNYGSDLRLLDFEADPEACRLTINNWVSDQTEERIKDLIPEGVIDPVTRLVLTNAIYFKASWLSQFSEKLTQEGPFTNLDGSVANIPMMSQTENFYYSKMEGEYQAVELLYEGEEVSMVIILPAEGKFKTFESTLNETNLKTIMENMTQQYIDLSMPKFKFEFKTSLVDNLKSLGMTDAFKPDGTADFSGIDGTKSLYISDVLHKSFVSVDEKGTEAAAATAVIINFTSLPTQVRVNRPFIFLIRDRITGAVLFLGRLTHLE